MSHWCCQVQCPAKIAVVHKKMSTIHVDIYILASGECMMFEVVFFCLCVAVFQQKHFTMSVFVTQAVRDGARQVATAEHYLNSLQVY